MTLEEAIKHAEEVAQEKGYEYQECLAVHDMEEAMNCGKCGEEHRQLAAWLRELQERRKAPEIVYCGACIHFQCNMRFDGSVPKGADAYECRHWCGGCDPMDYCSYGKRREGRTE